MRRLPPVLSLAVLLDSTGCFFGPLCGDSTIYQETYVVDPALIAMAESDGEITLDECQRLCSYFPPVTSDPPTTSGSSGGSTDTASSGGSTDTTGAGSSTGGTSTGGSSTGGSSTGGLSLMDLPPAPNVIGCPEVTDSSVTCKYELQCSGF